ncbi:MAG: hypothetical protein ACUVRV_09375 [Cyanobacteriota bacterium]
MVRWMSKGCSTGQRQLASGLVLVGCLGSLVACRAILSLILPTGGQLQDSQESAPQALRRYISKDGTYFEASLGDARALPEQFPAHLHLPQSSVVSSGYIRDWEGGMTSLVLQTSLPVQEISTYYRRSLWSRGWEILSDLEQANGIRTLVFESPQHSQQIPQQAVIQVGSPRLGPDQTEQRDILILLSTVPTGNHDFASGSPKKGSGVKSWSKRAPSSPL